MRQLEDEAGVRRLRRARERGADDDERGLVRHLRADFARENFSPCCPHRLLARDGRRAAFLRRERRRLRRAFDDDLLGLRIMLRQPRAAVVERRAVRTLHMADVGTENYDQEFTLGLIENEQGTLEQVQRPSIGSTRGRSGRARNAARRSPSPGSRRYPIRRYCIECARKLESQG